MPITKTAIEISKDAEIRYSKLSINERLREVRNILGLSQREMSERLNIKQSFLSDIENARRTVSNKFIDKLSQKLHISKDWMYTGKGIVITSNKGNVLYSESVPSTVPLQGGTQSEEHKFSIENQEFSISGIVVLDKIIQDQVHCLEFYCVDLLGRIALTKGNHINNKQLAKYVDNLQSFINSIKHVGMFQEPDYKDFTVLEKVLFVNQLNEKLKKCLDDLWLLGQSGKWQWNESDKT